MKVKQIYAALDIGSYDIKLVVGEFYNTRRVNVIRVERVQCNGVQNCHIIDKDEVSKAIMQALKNVNDLLQVQIERVLLSIPAVGLEQISKRITVPIRHQDRKITLTDLQEAIQSVYRSGVPSDKLMINVVPVKYYVDGLPTRRLPVGDTCDKLEVICDAFCVDKRVALEYCAATEKAGLEILDIYVQPYADAKEANILEQSVDCNYVFMNIGHETTTLSYFMQGRLADSISLNWGVGIVDYKISQKFNISIETANRLKQYNAHLFPDRVNDKPIYIWSTQGVNYSMNEQQLYEVLVEALEEFLYKIKETLGDSLMNQKVKIVLGGGGGEFFELAELASKRLGCEVTTYIPETMGARSSSLITCLGLFYAFNDACEYTLNDATSVDSFKFAESVIPSKTKEHEEGFTSRLKGLLFNENRERNKE